jgi:Zn-dependent peptidase ImmA (M78 family)
LSNVRAQLVARRVLSTLQLKPPIDLAVIIAHYDLTLVEWNLPGYVDGMLRKEQGQWYIGVNKFAVPGRKRFTVAHELMHYLMHKENRFCYRGMKDYREVEANVGAAELLMPSQYVKWWSALLGFDTKALAEHFGVSRQAMACQLDKMGILHI